MTVAALATAASASLIALPFVFPVVAGPSANVWQLLCSWTCAALLLLLAGKRIRLPAGAVTLWLGLLLIAILWRRGSDPSLYLGALMAVIATGLAACAGAGLARASARRQAAFAWALLAAGLVSAVLGLFQYYGAAAPLVPWTTAPEVGQAYGNLRQRNQFATLVSMALVAALWLHGRLVRVDIAQRQSGRRLAWWLAIALLLLAAAASTSRTGLLQWVSVCAISAALAWQERRRSPATERDGVSTRAVRTRRSHRLPPPWLLLALIPAYFAAAWALPMLAGPEVEDMLRRLREGAPEGHSRMLLWRNVLALIAEHPWAGWGWGELSYAHFTTLYAGERFVEILDNAHNLPLHLAVELGIPASLLLCGGFAALVLAARPWRERAPTRLMAWGVLGAIVLHSLLEYPLWYGPFQVAFGLCLGLLWPGLAASDNALRESRWLAAPVALRAVAASMLIAVAYTAWDYTRISQLYLARAERLAPWRENTTEKLQGSWLFANQVRFAELTLTPVVRANAAATYARASGLLHFSPEPRVAAKLIESATLLNRDEEAAALAARFKIAFPVEYARWLAGEAVE